MMGSWLLERVAKSRVRERGSEGTQWKMPSVGDVGWRGWGLLPADPSPRCRLLEVLEASSEAPCTCWTRSCIACWCEPAWWSWRGWRGWRAAWERCRELQTSG